MTTAERIVIGIASVIALIGWLRWVGEAGSQDVELRNQHPTGPPKYQRPSNEPSQANGQNDNDIANLTAEAHGRLIDVNQSEYESGNVTRRKTRP